MPRGRIILPLTHRERDLILTLLDAQSNWQPRRLSTEISRTLATRVAGLTIPDDETGPLVAPSGARIIGIIERVEGQTRITGSVLRRADGSLDYDTQIGSPTIAWDEAEPVLVDGEALFVDDTGAVWCEGDLVPAQTPMPKGER